MLEGGFDGSREVRAVRAGKPGGSQGMRKEPVAANT